MNVYANGILVHIGPILDDRLKDRLRKPWKGVLFTFVCVCVCTRGLLRSRSHFFQPRKLIFGLNNPWKMKKKHFFFENSIFTLLIDMFSLCNTSKVLFSSYWSVFHLGIWNLGWEDLAQIEIKDLWLFIFLVPFFWLKGLFSRY